MEGSAGFTHLERLNDGRLSATVAAYNDRQRRIEFDYLRWARSEEWVREGLLRCWRQKLEVSHLLIILWTKGTDSSDGQLLKTGHIHTCTRFGAEL